MKIDSTLFGISQLRYWWGVLFLSPMGHESPSKRVSHSFYGAPSWFAKGGIYLMSPNVHCGKLSQFWNKCQENINVLQLCISEFACVTEHCDLFTHLLLPFWLIKQARVHATYTAYISRQSCGQRTRVTPVETGLGLLLWTQGWGYSFGHRTGVTPMEQDWGYSCWHRTGVTPVDTGLGLLLWYRTGVTPVDTGLGLLLWNRTGVTPVDTGLGLLLWTQEINFRTLP